MEKLILEGYFILDCTNPFSLDNFKYIFFHRNIYKRIYSLYTH